MRVFFLILLIEKQQCAIFLTIEQEDTHTPTPPHTPPHTQTHTNNYAGMESYRFWYFLQINLYHVFLLMICKYTHGYKNYVQIL